MEIRLPETPGWSAAPLLSAEWDNLGVVVKREYAIEGDGIEPVLEPLGVSVADELNDDDLDNINIVQEADTALYKTTIDWHFLGYGSAKVAKVQTAELAVNGQARASFELMAPVNFIDPENLFGYEPRANRTGAGSVDEDDLEEAVDALKALNDANGIEMDPVTLARTVLAEVPFSMPEADTMHSPALFRSSRLTSGYATSNAAEPVPRNALVEVRAVDDDGEKLLLSVNVSLPQLTLTAYLWEGGPDNEAYWCQREPVELEADTVTLTPSSVQVLWRAALPGATHPIADMRLIRIEETA